MDGYIVLYLKWIANKDLLYGTWNVIWQPGWERMDTCICMAESIGCSLETVTTLLTGCNLNTKKKLKKKKQLEIRIKLQLLT